MSGPYWNQSDPDDGDAPLDIEGRALPVGICWMCGQRGPVFEGAVELADGKGGWTYELGMRCAETGDCRKRRSVPMQPDPTPEPDATGVGATPSPPDNDRRGIAGKTGYGLPGSEEIPDRATPKEDNDEWHF